MVGALLVEEVPGPELPAPTDAIAFGEYLLAGLSGNGGVVVPASVVAEGSRFHENIFGIFHPPELMQPVEEIPNSITMSPIDRRLVQVSIFMTLIPSTMTILGSFRAVVLLTFLKVER